MTHVLRPYQRTAVFDAIRNLPHAPLVVAPTGAGKTTIGTAIVHAYIRATGKPVVWVAHRHELLDQARQRLGPTPGITVQSVQALCRRPATDAGMLVFDEAHRSVAKSYQTVIERHPTAKRLGLTATPFRLDGRGLGSVYGKIVEAATTAELCDNGTLIDPTVYVVKPPDMSGVRVRCGEYVNAAESANTPEHRADIVGEYQKRLLNMRVLTFACSIAHSEAIVSAFRAAGVKAEHVDGNTPARIREHRIQQLRDGKISVLSNVELFTEGFDLPAIDALIVARPTASLAMHRQICGRVMRRADAKFLAIIHDHAGNTLRHGPVTTPLEYSLDDASRVSRSPSAGTGLRMCPECYRLNPSASTHCIDCGHEFRADADPAPIDGRATMTTITKHQERAMFWDRLCEEEVGFGYKPGAKYMKFKERFGDYPATVTIEDADVYVDPDTADTSIKREYYKQQLEKCIEKGWKPGAASFRYKELFGVWPKGFVADVKNQVLSPEDELRELFA